jgi:hypothetical protein
VAEKSENANMQGDAGHPINKVVDKKKNTWKKEGQGGGKAQGVADPQKILVNVKDWQQPEKVWQMGHINLSTRTSMFALVQQTFLAKNLVKRLLISTLDKVIYYKGTFFRKSFQHKIGWRPAEKMPFL